MRLNGELVASWHKAWNQPPVPSVSKLLRFDSTHFPHGSNLTVEVKVFATDGVHTNTSPAKQVLNRFSAYVQKDMATLTKVSEFAPMVGQANFGVEVANNSTWTKSDVRASLTQKTAFTVLTHGGYDSNGARFLDSNHNIGPPSNFRVYDLVANGGFFSAESARIEGIGEGSDPADDALPPYNDGEPVLAIAFLGACTCCHTNSFAQGLNWPLGTRYVPNPMMGDSNEAVVGFSDTTGEYKPDVHCMNHAEREFWAKLSAGFTASQARNHALDKYNDMIDAFEWGTPPPNKLEVGHMPCWGDKDARLTSLYNGSASTVEDRGKWNTEQ